MSLLSKWTTWTAPKASTWPWSPTRFCNWLQDLGLPKEYSLGHCGLSAASRHKLAFTSRHYSLLTATSHNSTLLNFFAKKLLSIQAYLQSSNHIRGSARPHLNLTINLNIYKSARTHEPDGTYSSLIVATAGSSIH